MDKVRAFGEPGLWMKGIVWLTGGSFMMSLMTIMNLYEIIIDVNMGGFS